MMAKLHEHPHTRHARTTLARLGRGVVMYCPLPPLAPELQDSLGMLPPDPVPESPQYDPTGILDPTDGTAFVGEPARVSAVEGERRLLAALLAGALNDARAGSRDAQEWVLNSAGAFSAKYCCEHLGQSYVAYVRRVAAVWPATPGCRARA
jgi:hypothetical protein